MLEMLLVVGVALCAPAFFAWRTFGLLKLKLQVGMNDDDVARRTFLLLLSEAKEEMWICDDGNNFPESIYNMPDIVDQIERRLSANSALWLFCLFSSNEETLFSEKLANHPRVAIRRTRPRRDVHFKIIDRGMKGYVSAHALDSLDRNYRSYDCSNVPQHIRHAALGRHLDSMAGIFPERAVA